MLAKGDLCSPPALQALMRKILGSQEISRDLQYKSQRWGPLILILSFKYQLVDSPCSAKKLRSQFASFAISSIVLGALSSSASTFSGNGLLLS